MSFLLYGLLDVVIDGYFDTVQAFDDYYDEVSEGLFADKPLSPEEQRNWFEMRRALVRFHRLVVPMREAVSGLMRREHGTLPEILYPYYQDVYDHVLRVNESTDSLRDLVSTIVETNISLRDDRQNQVMKKVTSWAAIIAVPTLITGWYGQNVPYPGSGEVGGVWVRRPSCSGCPAPCLSCSGGVAGCELRVAGVPGAPKVPRRVALRVDGEPATPAPAVTANDAPQIAAHWMASSQPRSPTPRAGRIVAPAPNLASERRRRLRQSRRITASPRPFEFLALTVQAPRSTLLLCRSLRRRLRPETWHARQPRHGGGVGEGRASRQSRRLDIW